MVAWDDLSLAISVALPPLAASVVCAWGVLRQPSLPWLDFGGAGLLLAGGCLVASWLLPLVGWPGWLAWRSTAVSFGLVLPALALHVATAARGLADPEPIVLAPALATGALLALTVLIAIWLVARQAFTCATTRAALLAPALLPIWLVGLIGQPSEQAIIGAAGFTFAVCALAAFLTCLARGWLAWLPVVVALAAVWAAQFALPPVAVRVTPTTTVLSGGHLALALLSSGLPLVVGLLVPRLLRRRDPSREQDDDEVEE